MFEEANGGTLLFSVSTHNPTFSKYYAHKKAEDKATRLICDNIANKLLRLMCAQSFPPARDQ